MSLFSTLEAGKRLQIMMLPPPYFPVYTMCSAVSSLTLILSVHKSFSKEHYGVSRMLCNVFVFFYLEVWALHL